MANAAEIERLVVRLTGDAAEYQKMLGQAQKETQATAAQIAAAANRIEGLGVSVQGFASSAVSALAAFGAKQWLQGAFGEFTVMENTAIRLTAALEVNGRAVESTLKDYREFASGMQQITTIGDDTVLAMLKTAESFDLTGAAAKQAVQDAIGLAGATDSSAEAMIRLTAAVAQGDIARAMMFSRMVPQLRGVKNELQFLNRYQKLVNAGMKIQSRLADTASGRLKQLKNDYGDLLEEIGAFVAEAVKPVAEGLSKFVLMLRKLSPELKRFTAVAAMVAAGIVLIPPALAVLSIAFAPLVSILKVVVGLVLSLLTPWGLLTAGIAALGAAVLHWTGTGGKALNVFMGQWDKLKNHFGPAITGIRNALKAGDLKLAFEIAWLQIKLSFAKATKGLREMWVGFTLIVQETWINTTSFLASKWEEATTSIAKSIVRGGFWRKVVDFFSFIPGFGEEVRKMDEALASMEESARRLKRLGGKPGSITAELDRELQNNLKEIEAKRKEMLRAAERDAQDPMRRISDEIKKLEMERARQLAKAANLAALEEARNRMKKQKEDLGGFKPEVKPVEIKLIPKFDAVAFRSAEAIARVAAFRETVVAPAAKQKGGDGGKDMMKSEELLGQIRDGVRELVKKPVVEVGEAEL